MVKHVAFKWAAAFALTASTVLALTVGASATPAPNLSFSASNDGASAGWSQGKGSAIELTLGSSSATTFAEITLHHLTATTIGGLSEPAFTTSNYAAGSPRYYITLSDGNTLWGYPPNSGLDGSDFAWTINNGNAYMSWSEVQTAEADATVTGAYVIADGDQPAGTVDEITGLTFGGTTYN